MTQDVKLKVVEAIQDDVNKGIVRVDTNFMREIGVKPGDIVEIAGGKCTVAMVDRALPGDIGLNTIRMDGLLRKNAKTGIGEQVKVKKAEIKEAKKITIAPSSERVEVRTSNTSVFKKGLLGRAVIKGDIISLGGTKRRRRTMTGSPFFDEVFSMMEEQNTGYGYGFGDLKLVVAETVPAKQSVIITEQTEIVLSPKAVKIEEDTIPEVTYEDIGGLSDEIKKIREMVELPLKHPEIFERLGVEPPKGVLLHGPPGTGKTLLAKAVANETNSHFILINGPEIMSKYYGQSEENIRKKFEEAEQNAPAIVFIDEIDAIATKREETKGEVEKRVVAQLLALMDGLKNRGRVVVIAATNVPNILDPALRRPGRFDRELEISVPNEEGRLNVLKIHTRNMPLAKDVNLTDTSKKTHGFVGADLASLTKEAAMIVLRRILPDLKYDKEEAIPQEILDKLTITKADFREALKVVRPSALREVFIDVPNVTWDNIGGMNDVRQELLEAVEWPLKHPDAFKRMGVTPPKGILLYGAPGTGKTLLAKAVAHESEANFISVKGPELLSKWVGESEKAVREIFKKARQTAPTIIFFDEIDSLVPRRGLSTDSHVTERVVNQLLTEIDGLEDLHDILIIGATNRPDMVDTALLRPGRFDRIILTPVPDEKTREEIFNVHTKDMPIKGVTIKELAAVTEGYVGADIEAICREAAIIALREDIKSKEINKKHFEEALQKVRPSVTKEIDQTYRKLRDHFTAAKAKEMQAQKPTYFG
ncbi:CDC48 family AAA ATPase [Candidatus Woesearchaeota archaeon]|nr:CDC48 family AAA ATPase [Candidatus Woesearchaeota archaeon]MBW2994034.1 CDC48 family AAA ATPase [Candidatus Woesearchaeota archaeon]